MNAAWLVIELSLRH